MKVQVLTQRPIGELIKNYLLNIGEELVTADPDILLLCYYRPIIKKEVFQKQPTVNFHPGYLPFNRGMYPHIWPLFDGSPGGVTLHYVTERVDAGNIIAQKRLPILATYTAQDFEQITQQAMYDLFVQSWDNIKAGVKGIPQKITEGSYHHSSDISHMQRFDRLMMRRLAACTFADRTYGYFIDEDGKKIAVGIKFYE